MSLSGPRSVTASYSPNTTRKVKVQLKKRRVVRCDYWHFHFDNSTLVVNTLVQGNVREVGLNFATASYTGNLNILFTPTGKELLTGAL